MSTMKWFALIFKPAPLGCERKLSPLLSPGLGRLFLPTNETERFPFHFRRAPRVRGWEGRKTSWRLGAGAHSQPVSKPMRKQYSRQGVFCLLSKNSRPPSKKTQADFWQKNPQGYGGNFRYQEKTSIFFDKNLQNSFKSSMIFIHFGKFSQNLSN